MALKAKQIFINFPVKDLKKTMAFFEAVGFEFNMQFTDDNAAALMIGDNIVAMLLHEPYFQSFTKKSITDASQSTEVILAFSADSRAAVDEIVQRALAAGAAPYNEPVDHGFMYSWSFEDPDGHLWEVVYMEEAAADGQ